MKVFLFTLLSSIFLLSPGLVNALELKDGTLVDSTNAHLYIEENANKFSGFTSNNYPNGFKAVASKMSNKPDLVYIFIYNRVDISLNNGIYSLNFIGPFQRAYYDSNLSCFKSGWNVNDCLDFRYTVYSQMNGNTFLNIDDILYISESLYYEDNLVLEKNWNSIPKYYEVKFNIPSGSNIVLKDSENNIVNSDSGNIYKLLSGNYTYSVSKPLHNTYNGSINVSDNLTLDIELSPIMDLSNFSDIFTGYKSYLLYLVPNIFNLDKPFFFVIFGISIIFSLILLLRKFMKGRF